MQPLPTQFLTDFPLFLHENELKNTGSKPHSCDYWNDLGCAAFTAGDFRKSLQAFDNSVYLSDKFHHYIHYECAATYILRARLHMQNKHFDLAKTDLNSAIFQDHNSESALLLRIWIAERIDNNRDDAAAYLKQLQRISPNAVAPARWQKTRDYRGILAEDSAWIRAVAHKDYALNMPSITAHDAALQQMEENPANAAELLSQVLRHPRAWRHYGEALMRAGRLEEAMEALNKAEKQHQLWHSAYHRAAAVHRLNRGLAYEKTGDVLLAWQECAKAADIDKHWQVAKEQTARLSQLACM